MRNSDMGGIISYVLFLQALGSVRYVDYSPSHDLKTTANAIVRFQSPEEAARGEALANEPLLIMCTQLSPQQSSMAR